MAEWTQHNRPISCHTLKFTGYMRWTAELFCRQKPMRVLDIPSGAGNFGDALRQMGHTVTMCDFNGKREEFVPVDMNHDFPFPDQSYDASVCLEGIEHMLEPDHLLKELLRVVKVGGLVVISTPNVNTFYSRLQFLLTGQFYQFNWLGLRRFGRDEQGDRFHIAPLDYNRLRYMAEYFGATVETVGGDKWKRVCLLPLFALLWVIGLPWTWSLKRRGRPEQAERNREILRHLNSPTVLFCRSLVLVLRKVEHVPHMPHARPRPAAAPVPQAGPAPEPALSR